MTMNEETAEDREVIIYTDGACSGNPGPGGWGAMIRQGDKTIELKGGEANTTNNRMELKAAIRALQSLDSRCHIILNTDSTYVREGITNWIHNWKKRGWKTAARKPVKNVDLWQELDKAVLKHDIDWRWVKAHVGIPGNERADRLANEGMDEARHS